MQKQPHKQENIILGSVINLKQQELTSSKLPNIYHDHPQKISNRSNISLASREPSMPPQEAQSLALTLLKSSTIDFQPLKYGSRNITFVCLNTIICRLHNVGSDILLKLADSGGIIIYTDVALRTGEIEAFVRINTAQQLTINRCE